MSMKGGYPFKGIKSPGIFVVAGRFQCNGASAPTVTEGAGFTVSAPATGVYTVTLTDGPVAGKIYLEAGVADQTVNSTARARIGAVTLGSAGSFKIVTSSSAGTDADLSAPVEVYFIALLRDTSATR